MYTSRDLFVTSNPWIGGELIYNGGLPSQSISVKYAVIPYSHDASGRWHYVSTGGIRSFIDAIFPVFDNLQTLYILIHPDKLRKGEQFEVLSLVPTMKEHLKTYKRTRKDTSPQRFQYGDRVYHEISDVLLMKLNQLPGLSQAVTDLEKVAKAQRAKNGGDKLPMVIRFMTW
ncbi:hypothetical protein HYE67_011202 [Fusarium culmorum]|uniref:Uncharacterized protein n=1 Tax=Fusarium culmorum TaxID=5516 RepID=A0A7S8DI12_FUSCU|nr:hypothetical protein HYE67_011202 [Fusarium culmorum]